MTEFSMAICSRRTKNLMVEAFHEALYRNHEWIEPVHFFLGILRMKGPELKKLFREYKIDPVIVGEKVRESLSKEPDKNISEIVFTPKSMQLLSKATKECTKGGQQKLQPEHILSVLLANRRTYLKRTTKKRS